jgi:hypothetical protein
MAGTKNPARRMASRRRVLQLTAGVFALSGMGVARLATAAAAKSTQKSVDYQNHPKGGHGCNSCKAFQPPSKCKTVEGPVEAGGWCSQYVHS